MEMVEIDLDTVFLFGQELFEILVRYEPEIGFEPILISGFEFDFYQLVRTYFILFAYDFAHQINLIDQIKS